MVTKHTLTKTREMKGVEHKEIVKRGEDIEENLLLDGLILQRGGCFAP